MSQPAKAQEPSMEEILASIRRIIADDDSKPAAKPAAAAPAPQPPGPAPVPAAAAPAPQPVAAPQPAADPPPEPSVKPGDVDAMLTGLDSLAPAPAPQDEGLDLTESMAKLAEPASPGFQTIDGQSDVVFTDPVAAPEPAPRVVEEARPERPMPSAPAAPPSLLSSTTSAAVDSAFNSLAQTVLIQNACTLEDLVREMLRPLLKSWLDDNLPGIVERIVRAEIERVSRGRN